MPVYTLAWPKMTGRIKFIADENVGKLARWLRLLGFDTIFFHGEDDNTMINIAIAENRIIVTRDTRIMERKVISGGRVKALLLKTDKVDEQEKIAITEFDLESQSQPFTICLECNQCLIDVNRDEVRDRVPPYIWQTQTQFMECPKCRRIYWRGSHWAAMSKHLTQRNIIKQK